MISHSKTSIQVEGVLLGLLADNPMHGYDLYKALRQPGGLSLVWRINQSNLYAILDKMEKEGYLSSEQIVVENGRPRKDFHITAEGLRCFQQWMHEPVQHGRDMRQFFMAKLYFALKDSRETAEHLVDEQYKLVIQWSKEVQSKLEELSSNKDYDYLLFQSRLYQISAWLELLTQCKNNFEAEN
jgi:DNA-binding PadR family transcriptional regulator